MKPAPGSVGGTPNGEYLMDLAESDPSALGASLELTADKTVERDRNGRPLKDANGEQLLPVWTPTEIIAVDFVDCGDAVNSLLAAHATMSEDELLRFRWTEKKRLAALDEVLRWRNRWRKIKLAAGTV